MKKSNSQHKPISVGFVSLGCPKNLVDLQVMGAELHQAGFEIGVETEQADVVLVNTCAFIEDAREEAISSILAACELKKTARCKAVVVSGCLPQRYHDKVMKACPEVDAIIGVDDLEHIAEVVRNAVEKQGVKKQVAISTRKPTHLYTSKIPSLILTGGPFAYLKIAEGCQHACAFCAIPGIRGKLRSRQMGEIVEEAKAILSEGIREINIIAQDITSYGKDLKDGISTLAALLTQLDALEGDFWIRLLYGYPGMITDELLDVIATSKHICHYFDIPIQHSSPDVLKSMLRADTAKRVPEMTTYLRSKIPDITIRTTCLVGFPGETEEQFKHLLDFTANEKFDHLGAFAFSPEEGTPAFDMDDDPDDIVAENRRKKLMMQQAKIVKKRMIKMVGSKLKILLEAQLEDESGESSEIVWVGRHAGQAPDEIDGLCYIRNVPENAESGMFIEATIVAFDDFDLICEVTTLP